MKTLLKNTYYKFLKQHPFFYIGKFLLLFKNKNYLLNEYGPKKLKSNNKSFLEECIRRVFNSYYYNNMNDEERNEYNLKHIWGSEKGDHWHKLSFEKSNKTLPMENFYQLYFKSNKNYCILEKNSQVLIYSKLIALMFTKV